MYATTIRPNQKGKVKFQRFFFDTNSCLQVLVSKNLLVFLPLTSNVYLLSMRKSDTVTDFFQSILRSYLITSYCLFVVSDLHFARNGPVLLAKRAINICSAKNRNTISPNDRIGFARLQ